MVCRNNTLPTANQKIDVNAEPVTRIGIHSVAVHDAIAEREVLEGDIKVMETGIRGPTKVMSKSEMMVRGYIIPFGTLIVLDVPIRRIEFRAR